MAWREARQYKALYFDLRVRDLGQYYSKTNPKGAHARFKSFLTRQDFSHAQYSGYHSNYKATDLEIFDLIYEMSGVFPWLQNCVNHFEVTSVGANHDLVALFSEEIDEPLPI